MLGSSSAQAFEIGNYRVFIHPDLLRDGSLRIWHARVKRILDAAQALLCEQCKRALAAEHQPAHACVIRLQLAEVHRFRRDIRREGRPTAVLDWSEINEVLGWGGQIGERTIYLVRDLRFNDSRAADHYGGVTSMRVAEWAAQLVRLIDSRDRLYYLSHYYLCEGQWLNATCLACCP